MWIKEFWLFHLPFRHLIGIFASSVRQIPDAIENRHNPTVVVGIEVLKGHIEITLVLGITLHDALWIIGIWEHLVDICN